MLHYWAMRKHTYTVKKLMNYCRKYMGINLYPYIKVKCYENYLVGHHSLWRRNTDQWVKESSLRPLVKKTVRACINLVDHQNWLDSHKLIGRNLEVTTVFSDIERLGVDASIVAAQWSQYTNTINTDKYLNHPTLSLSRFELLRVLYNKGINQFNVYHIWEINEQIRYPVFIRLKSDHDGPKTGLIYNADDLKHQIESLTRICSREELMIVEFIDISDDDGIYRKYGTMFIGDSIIANHLQFSTKWLVKYPEMPDECYINEELTYVTLEHPHEQEIRDILDIANIQYGRIDYSILDGKIQVWEINTNPSFVGEEPPTGSRKEVHEYVIPKIASAFIELSER